MSDPFIVSARKYRPSTFETVVGQDHIAHTLKKAVSEQHLAQAYLFTGPRGVGKTTCARILAKAINCETPKPDGEPCNECQSCRIFNEQRSMNIYELDAASNNSVEDIRALVDQVRFPPQGGKYKVYIIDEVHMLSAAAFNAFLKTLEEPPPYAIFILATTEKQKIIPTILSRCQIYDFKRIAIQDMVALLKKIASNEKIEAEESGLHIIAQKADGAMRDALSIFDRLVAFCGDKLTYQDIISNLNIIDYDQFFSAAAFVAGGETQNMLLLINEIINTGFDGLNFLNGMAEHYRNLFVCKSPETVKLLELPESVISKYAQQAAETDVSLILSSLNILNQFSLSYKESKNQRLHTELAFIKLCHLKDAIDLAKQVSEQKKNLLTEQPKPKQPVNQKQESQPVQKNLNGLNLSSYANRAEKKTEPEETSTFVNNQISENTIENNEFQKDEFLRYWNDYLDSFLKNEKKNLYTCLKNNQPVFQPDNSIRIKFENAALQSMFTQERQNITEFIREKLKIDAVMIETEVVAPTEEDQAKYFSNPKEKFAYMAQLNPELENMRIKFGLQPEG